MPDDAEMNSYKEVEDRVQAYLRRDPDSAERLIQAFRRFLIRWLQVIRGKAHYWDKNHRIFVSLYVPFRGVRMRILKSDKRGEPQFMYWLSIIRERYGNTDRDEHWNELVGCLLELASRYKPYEGYYEFHNYASRSFPYYLHRRLEQYAGDVSAFAQMIVPFDEDPDFEAEYQTAAPVVYDDIVLGETWIGGATAGDGFSALSPLDRKIILHYYEEGLSDRQIAERVGLGRCAINRRRIQAVKKLREVLEEH